MRLYQKADGGVLKSARSYPIAANTSIKAGQVVTITAGLVTAPIQKQTGAVLGVALENHGTADVLDPRATGEEILVCDTPDAIFRCKAPTFAATNGSATTVITDDLGAFSNDDFNGGVLVLVKKADGSTNTDKVGMAKRITDYGYTAEGTVSTFTVASAGTAYSGDEYALLPPIGFKKGQLTSTFDGFSVADTCSLAMKVVGYDAETQELLMMANIHVLGVEE